MNQPLLHGDNDKNITINLIAFTSSLWCSPAMFPPPLIACPNTTTKWTTDKMNEIDYNRTNSKCMKPSPTLQTHTGNTVDKMNNMNVVFSSSTQPQIIFSEFAFICQPVCEKHPSSCSLISQHPMLQQFWKFQMTGAQGVPNNSWRSAAVAGVSYCRLIELSFRNLNFHCFSTCSQIQSFTENSCTIQLFLHKD